ncbi:MAG: 50S ribosomal protein L35 [Candidatus Shikimatogenerans bostrichidophilus]|nr:MAG: 50S ribosomal protein L35 [Candidatus Shikimatogenerans bostrichidophilus]
MYKIKNKSSYKKRFKLISNGKVKRKKSNKLHNLKKKNKVRKKKLSKNKIINLKIIK